MTDGLVFLSVEVVAWSCQAHAILEGVEGNPAGNTENRADWHV